MSNGVATHQHITSTHRLILCHAIPVNKLALCKASVKKDVIWMEILVAEYTIRNKVKQ
jgi:hypothetical protein